MKNLRNHDTFKIKERLSTNKEMNSLSISKKSMKNLENLYNSQDKDPFSEQRCFEVSSIKQNLQMKALKSLIKTKYGTIPANFLSVFYRFFLIYCLKLFSLKDLEKP